MSPSGRGIWALNVLRVCSVISLLMAIVASWTTLIKSFVVTRFYFFDAINEVLLSVICAFMLLSECSVAEAYFTKNWPLFSRRSSLVSLGIAEVMIGFSLLGHLNEGFASKENLGVAFHALLLSSGVVVSVIGVCNFISSFVYQETDTGRTARMMRSWMHQEPEDHGLPIHHSPEVNYKMRSASPTSTYKAPYHIDYSEEAHNPPAHSVVSSDHNHGQDNNYEHNRERNSELADLGGYRLGTPSNSLQIPERMYSHRTYRTTGQKSNTSSIYSRTINGTSLYDPKDRY